MRYLMAREWARFPDDILWRRSKLGLTMEHAERERLAAFMAAAMMNGAYPAVIHSAAVEPGRLRG